MKATETEIGRGLGERELRKVISSYTEVTEKLRESHDRLQAEVKHLHVELANKSRELARRERLAALGQMAAGLAHEIRNPLASILLFASLLEKELSADERRLELARKIAAGVRSLEGLVADILAFAGESEPQLKRTSLGRVVQHATELLSRRFQELGVRLLVSEELGDIELTADETQLRSAVANLTLNGAEAAGRGGEVRVSASTSEGGEERLRISVSDTGPGVPPEMLDRIFNPFFTSKPSGTGLGLAIVHRIAESHGGRVWARNREQGGAEFVLELPAGRIPEASDPPRETTLSRRAAIRPERSRFRGASLCRR